MTQQATKTRKPTEITSPVVYRCTDKVTGEIFYAVKSDSTDATYKVSYNAEAHRYECSCPATCECKHLRAIREIQLAKAEMKKQEITSPAPAPEYRVSRVDGLTTKWYPEYKDAHDGQWYRFPQPDGNRAESFVIEGRAEAWLADRLAEVEGSKAESKMFAWKRGMDEQYSSDPRTELAKQREVEETAASYMRHFYDEY